MSRLIVFILAWVTSFVVLAEEATRPVLAGEVAPDFTLTRMDGTRFTLSDYQGQKSVYLIFWNTWCPHCLHKVPKVMLAQQELHSELEIIAINTSWSDSVEAIGQFQQAYKTNYAIAFDSEAQVTDAYGVWGAPTEFIVDINGVVRYRDDLPDNLGAHLANWNRIDDKTQVAGVCVDKEVTC